MTEPSEEELERAERIRKLRSGGAKSRGREMRERRRERSRDDEGEGSDDQGAADDETAGEGAAENETADEGATEDEATDPESDHQSADGTDGDGASAGVDPASGSPLAAAGDTDVLELAADLPEDGSLFVVPVTEELRREFARVAEQLHLRYGFEYKSELDGERHVRPLALYLGVQALADADVEGVRELLTSVDELAAPDAPDDE